MSTQQQLNHLEQRVRDRRPIPMDVSKCEECGVEGSRFYGTGLITRRRLCETHYREEERESLARFSKAGTR